MKKNYIAPNTEMTTWASMGIMNPEIGFAACSGGGQGDATLNDASLIN